MTLDPGDVTHRHPGRVGFVQTAGFLRPGDIVEVEIEGLGVLRNGVAHRVSFSDTLSKLVEWRPMGEHNTQAFPISVP